MTRCGVKLAFVAGITLLPLYGCSPLNGAYVAMVPSGVELRVVPACRNDTGFDGARLLAWESEDQVDVTEGLVVWEVRKRDSAAAGSLTDRVLLGATPSDYDAVVPLTEPLNQNRVYVAYFDEETGSDQLYADFTLTDLDGDGFYHYVADTEDALLDKSPGEFNCG